MEPRSMHGWWWTPSAPDRRKPGVLSIAADGDIELELIGGFDLTIRRPLPEGGEVIGLRDKELPVLYGDCEGKQVTLLNCHNKHSRGWFDTEPSFQRLYAQRAVLGAHLSEGGTDTFRAASLKLENLTLWLNLPSIARTFGFQDGVTKAEVRLVDQPTVVVEGWEYRAGQSVSGFRVERHREDDSVIGNATAEMRVIPPAPATLGEFDRVALEFMDLLTLAAGQPCGLIDLQVDLLEDEVYQIPGQEEVRTPRKAEIVGRRIHTADPTAPAVDAHRMLFSCADVSFQDLLPAWLEVRRQAAASCNVFFGLQYARPGFTEIRVLLLAVVTETLHRRLHGDVGELPQQQFDELREKLLRILDDEEEKAWVKRKLRNEPSFRERAVALAADPAQAAVDLAVPDVAGWAGELVKARNGLAHTAGEGMAAGLFELEQRTAAVISLVLMARLGLSTEVQVRAVDRALRVFE